MNQAGFKKILMLGAGYTLRRASQHFDKRALVLTCTTETGALELTNQGFEAFALNAADAAAVDRFFKERPDISIVVDSVPPIKDAEDPLSGVRNISRALGRLKEPRVIYLSTTGVFGEEDGGWVNNTSRPNPKTPQAELRLRSEKIYRENASLCAVRIAGIYGPGRGLGLAMRAGTYRLVEGGERWTNRIHADDLARIIAGAAINIESAPEVLCAADDEPAASKDVAQFYSQKFSLPFPQSISLEEARKRGMHTLTGNQRVSNAATKSFLNLALNFPTYREGAGSEFL